MAFRFSDEDRAGHLWVALRRGEQHKGLGSEAYTVVKAYGNVGYLQRSVGLHLPELDAGHLGRSFGLGGLEQGRVGLTGNVDNTGHR